MPIRSRLPPVSGGPPGWMAKARTARSMFLERHRPEVFQGKAQLSGDVLADSFGEDDPTGLGESLQPCGDVDPFPIEITIFGDHITQVEPHAKAE